MIYFPCRRYSQYAEIFWLDETSPHELRRRANDIAADGLLAVAVQFRERADELERAND